MKSLKGFSDPNRNWGSSVGTGHDAAMKLRTKLGDFDKRQEFISDIVSNSGAFDLEDVKLALALRFQRTSSTIGSEEGYRIMSQMARLKYESREGEEILRRDLSELVRILNPKFVAEAGPVPLGGANLMYVAAQALCGMRFSTVGI